VLPVAALNRRSRLTATSDILTSSGHDAKGQPIENPAEEMNYHHHTSGGPPGCRVTLSRRAVGRLRWLVANAWGSDWGLKLALPEAASFWNLSRRYGSF
jgi:hypothetical protein